MTKEILEKLEFDQQQLTLIRNWRIFNNKIIHFSIIANLNLFKDILGDDVLAENLIGKFTNICDRKWLKFEPYLKEDWKELFLRYILNYCDK